MTTETHVINEHYPFRQLMVVISDKWSSCVLYSLSQGVSRPGEIGRKIPGISKKMLTQTLRSLEKMDMIDRTVYEQIPPKVEYKLTATGEKFLELLWQMHDWAGKNPEIINKAYTAKMT